ncbi:hypothetical protein GGS20DRAFT_229490 [Poronia punctata]|nr:hypothetical protein GGS20DRAFT_229490 [Poronia punctata]
MKRLSCPLLSLYLRETTLRLPVCTGGSHHVLADSQGPGGVVHTAKLENDLLLLEWYISSASHSSLRLVTLLAYWGQMTKTSHLYMFVGGVG